MPGWGLLRGQILYDGDISFENSQDQGFLGLCPILLEVCSAYICPGDSCSCINFVTFNI